MCVFRYLEDLILCYVQKDSNESKPKTTFLFYFRCNLFGHHKIRSSKSNKHCFVFFYKLKKKIPPNIFVQTVSRETNYCLCNKSSPKVSHCFSIAVEKHPLRQNGLYLISTKRDKCLIRASWDTYLKNRSWYWIIYRITSLDVATTTLWRHFSVTIDRKVLLNHTVMCLDLLNLGILWANG